MTALFRWPPAAAVGRDLTKERLYKEAAVGAAVRRHFIDEVQHVRWAYKLAENTIHLAGSDDVPEVQVFEIALKGQEISDTVMGCIDKSVPSPIIFELLRERASQHEAQLAAAPKHRDHDRTKIGTRIRGEWTLATTDRDPLPPAIDLHGLYTQVMLALLPITPRRGEDLQAALARLTNVRKVERQIAALERQLQREPQFNRKVDLRSQLRVRTAELAALVSTPASPENPSWTS